MFGDTEFEKYSFHVLIIPFLNAVDINDILISKKISSSEKK